MALFSRTTKKAKADAPKETVSAVPVMRADVAHVLLNPRITEKATDASMQSVYVFDVAVSANKKQIMSAVKNAYNVTPRAVHIVTIRPKVVRNMRTGRSGMKSGGKKAYVYLAKGDTITIA
jgi:ribosomal protein L23